MKFNNRYKLKYKLRVARTLFFSFAGVIASVAFLLVVSRGADGWFKDAYIVAGLLFFGLFIIDKTRDALFIVILRHDQDRAECDFINEQIANLNNEVLDRRGEVDEEI